MTPITAEHGRTPAAQPDAVRDGQILTIDVAGQSFGIPALRVHDVLGPQRITRVPLAPREVAGALNLRGRAVTAVDLRLRLGLPPRNRDAAAMNVVVDHDGDHYGLLVDQVGEVLTLSAASYERNPTTLDARWRELSTGIHRLDGGLLILLDIDRLLQLARPAS